MHANKPYPQCCAYNKQLNKQIISSYNAFENFVFVCPMYKVIVSDPIGEIKVNLTFLVALCMQINKRKELLQA